MSEGDLTAGSSAADRLARAARAAQALSEMLWEALHEQLATPRGAHVAELCERLSDAPASLALLAHLEEASGRGAAVADRDESAVDERESVGGRGEPVLDEDRSVAGRDDTDASQGGQARGRNESASEPLPPSGRDPRDESPREGAPARAQAPYASGVLVDERAPMTSPAPASGLASAPVSGPAPSPPVPESAPPPPPLPAAPEEIEIRDERGELARRAHPPEEDRPAPWLAAIGRRLERYERDRSPFAVLAVELADVDRLRHAELPGEMSRLTGLVESALAGKLAPADALVRESPGRYWLLAGELDAGRARTLAERLAGAVRGAASHRGAPLEVSVGIAGCPADGTQAGALAAHAEVSLYAARAAGRPVA